MNEYTGKTQRLTLPTIRVDVLDDTATWQHREESAKSILRTIFIAVFVFAVAALVLTFTILGVLSLILEAGYRSYMIAAPFILLGVLGWWFRGKRS